ncbi:phage tail assembly chaperone [Thalassobaculum sp.]|uniref:phage tail assembly chaperone n=1 Tax=Thalassobaculum sp. TaxID=2022740 RepID=UPI0032F00CCB
MTFVLVKERTFRWPVRVTLPTDQGKQTTNEFTGHFRLLPVDEFNKKNKAWIEALSDDLDKANELRFALVSEILTGWDGVVDTDNNPVPFSDETLKALCTFAVVVKAITDAYGEALEPAGERARRKGN